MGMPVRIDDALCGIDFACGLLIARAEGSTLAIPFVPEGKRK